MNAHTGQGQASREIKALGRALRQDIEALAAHAPVPSASAVWFRAERRARLDALRRAERPIWLAERLALVGVGVVLGWLSSLSLPWLRSEALPGRATEMLESLSAAASAAPASALALLALCAGAASLGLLTAVSHE